MGYKLEGDIKSNFEISIFVNQVDGWSCPLLKQQKGEGSDYFLRKGSLKWERDLGVVISN